MAKKDKKGGLFTKAALEKLSSPEQLDVMMEVTKPKGWIALSAIAFLLVVLILWSIFGSIPTTVDGQGILIRGDQLVEVQAKTEGSVEEMLVQAGDEVLIGDPIALVRQGGLQKEIDTIQDDLATKTQEFSLAETQMESANSKQIAALTQNIGTLDSQLQIQQIALRDADQEVSRAEDLLRRGLGTGPAVASAKANRRDITGRILTLNQQRKEIPGQIDALKVQLQQLKSTNFLELERLRRELENTELQKRSATKVVSSATGRVLEVRVRAGTLVTSPSVVVSLERLKRVEKAQGKPRSFDSPFAGTIVEIAPVGSFVKKSGTLATVDVDGELKSISSGKLSGKVVRTLFDAKQPVKKGEPFMHFQVVEVTLKEQPLQGVFYVPAGDGKKIKETNKIRISPSTVKKEEFGTMKGVVTTISRYPKTRDGMFDTLKDNDLVQEFRGDSSPLEVNAELLLDSSPENDTGYAWSSGTGPPNTKIIGGTKCTASIVVEERAPILYVIPALKKFFGI